MQEEYGDLEDFDKCSVPHHKKVLSADQGCHEIHVSILIWKLWQHERESSGAKEKTTREGSGDGESIQGGEGKDNTDGRPAESNRRGEERASTHWQKKKWKEGNADIRHAMLSSKEGRPWIQLEVLLLMCELEK